MSKPQLALSDVVVDMALSKVVVFTKYAKYLPSKKRRETWDEIVDRYLDMMRRKYPSLNKEIQINGFLLRDKDILMSMRAAQFSGIAMEKNESRGYNCAYMPIDDYRSFSEAMFLLLGGTGLGYSVQYAHVARLPEIRKPSKSQKYLIEDSIEGWADAVKHLMKAYFGLRETKPRFDFSSIRSKGERLVTAGGKAPGPEPLRRCLMEIELILDRFEDGYKLRPIDAHDILCHIANAVLAGGIRRAALIALFSADDSEMINCKSGTWWEENPQRGRANNSAVLLRHRAKKAFFKDLWKRVQDSGSGEPGIYFSNDPNWGTNPCCEIALRPYQFCNLCEVNAGNIKNQKDFNRRARAAAFFGTLQAGFTDFHYLRSIWQKNTEKDSLVGVGITGICNGNLTDLDLTEAAEIVKEENAKVAKAIGINEAARTTTIKPSGSTSCVLETSSGIHAWHSDYYIRNIQCSVGDDLYNYFTEYHPKLIKIMDRDPLSAVIGIPQEAPMSATSRNSESSLDMLNRVERFYNEWVTPGHRDGFNTNNVSATVYAKDDEWDSIGEWMWKNRKSFNGLSCFPFDGGTYADTPFTEITEKEYKSRIKFVNNIDLTKIKEDDDNTELQAEVACSSGACN